jgi:5-formyltetrahydrofolate cyclo-ligase
VHCELKERLRQQMREYKRQYHEQMPSMSENVRHLLVQRLSDVHTIMAYWPLPDEVDLRPLLDTLVSQGRVVLLPKVLDKDNMELRRYTSQADLA